MKCTLPSGTDVMIDIVKKEVPFLSIRIYAKHKIKLTVPMETTDEQARSFVNHNKRWIQAKIFDEKAEQTVCILGEDFLYTVHHGEKSSVKKGKNGIEITVGEGQSAQNVFDAWFDEQALAYFQKLTAHAISLLGEYELKQPKVSLKIMKKRWGECNVSKWTIAYARALYCAERLCVEYVVLHEIAHLLYPNHGVRFEEFLARVMPGWKTRQQSLNRTRTENVIVDMEQEE